jgi:uridine kinase
MSSDEYRIRHLKGNLPELAQEMGNSPREIINSYKRNVTDADADKWFNIMPPKDYAELIYQHIQNQSRQFGVSSREDAIPSFTQYSRRRGFNASLGSV